MESKKINLSNIILKLQDYFTETNIEYQILFQDDFYNFQDFIIELSYNLFKKIGEIIKENKNAVEININNEAININEFIKNYINSHPKYSQYKNTDENDYYENLVNKYMAFTNNFINSGNINEIIKILLNTSKYINIKINEYFIEQYLGLYFSEFKDVKYLCISYRKNKLYNDTTIPKYIEDFNMIEYTIYNKAINKFRELKNITENEDNLIKLITSKTFNKIEEIEKLFYINNELLDTLKKIDYKLFTYILNISELNKVKQYSTNFLHNINKKSYIITIYIDWVNWNINSHYKTGISVSAVPN
jgi:hypothetical protein